MARLNLVGQGRLRLAVLASALLASFAGAACGEVTWDPAATGGSAGSWQHAVAPATSAAALDVPNRPGGTTR
jgi:hypothetical protein